MNHLPEEGSQNPPHDHSTGQRLIEFFSPRRVGSAKSPVATMLLIGTIGCLAAFGALTIFYQVATYFIHPDAALWLCVAIPCAAPFIFALARRKAGTFEASEKKDEKTFVDPNRKDSQSPKMDWKSFIAMGIMLMAFKAGQQSLQPKQQSFVPPPRDTSASRSFIVQRDQKRQATATYWQTAVANFHAIRFQTPIGQESAEKYYGRMFQQLRSLTDAAKSAPTVNVDADLVQMAKGHLAVEDQYLALKKQIDALMQRQRIPTPTDTVSQRMELTHVLLTLLALNPDLIDQLPPGPERDLVEKGMALEQARQEQLREIEIMQATLRERYNGTEFPLPTIDQQ